MMHPGEHVADFRALVQRNINGALPVTLNMIRTISGLSLSVRCQTINGFYAGSCSYPDLCKDLFGDLLGNTPENCPPELYEWGIDCTCPFNLPVQTVDGNIAFFISTSTEFWISDIMGVGDFELTANIRNNRGEHVACFRFLYSTLKRPLGSLD